MKLCFIGDVMLGRMIGNKYNHSPYTVVDPKIIEQSKRADFVIANLESPIAITAKTEGDHLQFSGNPKILPQFSWISLFSLANNHITDCGIIGIEETLLELKKYKISETGIFTNSYSPFILRKDKEEIALVSFTDMLNLPFPENSPYHVLRMGDPQILDCIKDYKSQGIPVIVFAHVGILFTRYPNPITREYLHKCVDAGASAIVTCHSHCLGGMETYKNIPIFHSLGDFCMDGNSSRRRTAAILNMNIKNGEVSEWTITPTYTDDTLTTVIPSPNTIKKIEKRFNEVSRKIKKNSDSYTKFFKHQYKIEILKHSLSTLSFLYKDRGLSGLLRMLLQRNTEVGRTIKWAISDRSKDQRDDDAIKKDRKKITQEELFGK